MVNFPFTISHMAKSIRTVKQWNDRNYFDIRLFLFHKLMQWQKYNIFAPTKRKQQNTDFVIQFSQSCSKKKKKCENGPKWSMVEHISLYILYYYGMDSDLLLTIVTQKWSKQCTPQMKTMEGFLFSSLLKTIHISNEIKINLWEILNTILSSADNNKNNNRNSYFKLHLWRWYSKNNVIPIKINLTCQFICCNCWEIKMNIGSFISMLISQSTQSGSCTQFFLKLFSVSIIIIDRSVLKLDFFCYFLSLPPSLIWFDRLYLSSFPTKRMSVHYSKALGQ